MDKTSAEATKKRFPGIGWLSSKLSRKMMAALIGVAFLSWGLMCACFLAYLGAYAGDTYDSIVAEANGAAERVSTFLEGSGGNFDGLKGYLAERKVCCTVRDSEDKLLFEYMPFDDMRLSASGNAQVTLSNGETMKIHTWIYAMEKKEIGESLFKNALLGLSVLNACVFLILALMIYLLVLSPIVRLRKIMRRYYESGSKPERSQRLDEIGRLQNTFADMVGVMEDKEKAEHRLIASISHDIKTPLTSVMGYSERLLSAELPPEKQQRYLRSVYEKAINIKTILDEFDDYIDVGLRDTAPMRLMTAQELCDSLQEEYQTELLDANVEFQVECRDPEAKVICNWEHMRRFFGNLISNSIQHAERKDLNLKVICQKEDKMLVFLFSDNGKGVDPELLQQIFEPLYTSDRGRKVSGLGLSICKGIINAHGGTISAENLPEGGLQIRATLPLSNS